MCNVFANKKLLCAIRIVKNLVARRVNSFQRFVAVHTRVGSITFVIVIECN